MLGESQRSSLVWGVAFAEAVPTLALPPQISPEHPRRAWYSGEMYVPLPAESGDAVPSTGHDLESIFINYMGLQYRYVVNACSPTILGHVLVRGEVSLTTPSFWARPVLLGPMAYNESDMGCPNLNFERPGTAQLTGSCAQTPK